jgi:hypothetical protein
MFFLKRLVKPCEVIYAWTTPAAAGHGLHSTKEKKYFFSRWDRIITDNARHPRLATYYII